MASNDGGFVELFEEGAHRHGQNTALCGDRTDDIELTYAHIPTLVQSARNRLNENGVPDGGTVLLVCESNLQAAILFVALAAHFTVAPLSPRMRRDEIRGRIRAIRPVVVLFAGAPSADLGEVGGQGVLPVFQVEIRTGPIPELTLRPFAGIASRANDGRRIDGGGLILGTSGTTGTPKLVHLQGPGLVRSARNVAADLGLEAGDSGIIVMPLFHIHGLVAGLLAPLAAGATITIIRDADPKAFLQTAARIGARWYTGVPTLHQAIVQEARDRPDVARNCRFRLIRSCSSPLPKRIRRDLEDVFDAPVLEAYGMTEASHQISSQSIGDNTDHGTVGIPENGTVRLLDETGEPVPDGNVGEVAILGPNVMDGYLDNPRANQDTFVNGWMRTGDIGRMLPDGSLVLVARKKEIIKRAGHQIAPAEIEDVFLSRHEIAQAVVFGVDHRTLGQDLAAAVVVKRGCDFAEASFREVLFDLVSAHKVPSRIIPVPAIPTGPTGKLKRVGLQYDLARDLVPAYREPETKTQEILCELVNAVLDAGTPIGIDADFFISGGDSLSAARLINRINDVFFCDLPPQAAFRFPTIAGLSAMLERLNVGAKRGHERRRF